MAEAQTEQVIVHITRTRSPNVAGDVIAITREEFEAAQRQNQPWCELASDSEAEAAGATPEANRARAPRRTR